MTVVVLGERPEVTELIERRRRLGQDRLDEVWEGVYHVAPDPAVEHGMVAIELAAMLRQLARERGLVMTLTFNLGDGKEDFRVPDFGFHAGTPTGVWVRTAVIVGEILSRDDETWQKFDFYARRGVEEVLVVDPPARRVRVFLLQGQGYDEALASPRLGRTAEQLGDLDWPG